MAKDQSDDFMVVDFIMENLCEMMETPAGPGADVGLVYREGEGTSMLLDQGERMPGGIVVLRSLDRRGLNLEGAVKIAREEPVHHPNNSVFREHAAAMKRLNEAIALAEDMVAKHPQERTLE